MKFFIEAANGVREAVNSLQSKENKSFPFIDWFHEFVNEIN
eukprot:UN06553